MAPAHIDHGFNDVPTVVDIPPNMALGRTNHGFDDEPTVIQVHETDIPPEPPPLPFELKRKKRTATRWVEELPSEAQLILERAQVRAPAWPLMPRLPGAVCHPID